MSILSLFASQEKLFAQYLAGATFNEEIHAEYRCPGRDQDQVRESYFTHPDKVPKNQKLSSDQRLEMGKKRVDRLARGVASSCCRGPSRCGFSSIKTS